MAQLVSIRENVIRFYQKYGLIVGAVIKFALSFVTLYFLAQMFDFGSKANIPVLYVLLSLIQAFLPIVFLYFSGSLLIMLNLWQLSPDILAGFVLLFLIGCLTLVRVDRKSAWIAMAVPVLFYLKLEYIAPVLLGITVGMWAAVPASMGILIYFLSVYTESVSTLLTTTEAAGPAAGLQRIANLIMIDKYLLVIFAAYCSVIFITALLNRLFFERAWQFAIIVGNVVLAVLMLCGRYIFDLDYEVWRVFLEVILSAVLCVVYWFFKGIGDASRTERTVFEDDEYIYYVKAVPKLKIAQKDHNVRDIHMEPEKTKGRDKAAQTPPAGQSDKKGEKTPAKHSKKKRDKNSSGRVKKEMKKDASTEAGTGSGAAAKKTSSGDIELKAGAEGKTGSPRKTEVKAGAEGKTAFPGNTEVKARVEGKTGSPGTTEVKTGVENKTGSPRTTKGKQEPGV